MNDLIHGGLLVWYVLTAGSLVFLLYDLATNTPTPGVMKAAWILIFLYTGPVGLFVYLLACRQPMPGTHDAFIQPHWKQAVGSLTHCVAGDATGIIIAASLVYAFQLPNGIDLILEYATAFVVGLLIFQALFMKEMFGGYFRAVRKTFFAEFVSMNMVMVGMFPVMLILMHLLPGADNPTQPVFWGVMSLATIAGGLTTYPINSWMVRRGIKHGMITAKPKRDAPGKPAPSHGPSTEPPAEEMASMDHGKMATPADAHAGMKMEEGMGAMGAQGSDGAHAGHGMPSLPMSTVLLVGLGTAALLLLILALLGIWIPIRFV